MRAQNPKIFRTATRVFFASRANLQHVADLTGLNQFADHIQLRRVSTDVGHGEFQVSHFTRLNHLIRFTQCSTERLLHVHVTAMFRAGQNHVAMLINPSRTNRHDVRLFFIEHFTVVGITPSGPCSRHSLGAACFILIGDGHNFALFNGLPDSIQPVPVVASSRAADDRDLVFGHDLFRYCWRRDRMRETRSRRRSDGRRVDLSLRRRDFCYSNALRHSPMTITVLTPHKSIRRLTVRDDFLVRIKVQHLTGSSSNVGKVHNCGG